MARFSTPTALQALPGRVLGSDAEEGGQRGDRVAGRHATAQRIVRHGRDGGHGGGFESRRGRGYLHHGRAHRGCGNQRRNRRARGPRRGNARDEARANTGKRPHILGDHPEVLLTSKQRLCFSIHSIWFIRDKVIFQLVLSLNFALIFTSFVP